MPIRCSVVVLTFALCAGCSARIPAGSRQPAPARNVILFIGDGMGDSEITIARNYQVGAAGRLRMDELPFTADCVTFAIEEDAPRPTYVADSAAGATALATGVKTSNRRVSSAPQTGADLKTIVELAQAAGRHTGLVTTCDLTDATPAAFAGHLSHRYCRSPKEMQLCADETRARGGRGPMTEQVANSGIDVLLGGGRERFDQLLTSGPAAGHSAREAAADNGYQVIETAEQLRAASSAFADRTATLPPSDHPPLQEAANPAAVTLTEDPGRLLGLFAREDLDPVWTGELAMPYPGSGPQSCTEGRRPPEQPSLAAMTRAAINRLDRRGEEGAQGFFLMVEGSSIDKRDHLADPCGQVGETIDFDEAVGVGIDYARRWRDTLVIVTADHGHSSQIVAYYSDEDRSPGQFSRLTTREGGEMIVNYATNIAARKQGHTGTQLRAAALGPQAERFHGLIDQTDIFHIMVDALGLSAGR